MPDGSTGATALGSEPGTEGAPGPSAAGATEAAPADGPAAGARVAPRRDRRLDPRWELLAFLELLAICGLAITQPALDVTGRSADFFIFNSADPIDFVLLLVAATLPVPIAAWALGAAFGVAGRRARRAAHVACVGAALALLAVVVAKRLTPLRGLPLCAAAAGLGAAGALVYARTEFLRQALRIASLGPALFVALFVLASPAGAVLTQRGPAPVATPAAASVGAHPPIVLVVLDEFSLVSLMGGDGRIDAERFPNFAALAGESTWYRNATAVSAYTPYALPSMLNGRYPFKPAAPFHLEYPENLFTLLERTYELRVQESISRLCPPSSCEDTSDIEPAGGSSRAVLRGAAGALAEIISPNDPTGDPATRFEEPIATDTGTRSRGTSQRRTQIGTSFGFGALKENQPSRFTEFVEGLRPSATPTLHFLHLILPHAPYRYLATGTRYDPAPRTAAEATGVRGDAGDALTDGKWWKNVQLERYEEQLAYTDALVGEAVRAMKASGLYDEALVVITADHGLTFEPGYGNRDFRGSLAEVLWVPLFIKEPGQTEGRIDDRNWEQADLLPTIADWAGVEVPWEVDGISQRGPGRDRKEKWFYERAGVRITLDPADGFKAVLRGKGPRAAAPHELVGQRVDTLQVADSGQVASIDGLRRFADLDPAKPSIPAFVYGQLPPDLPDDSRVAIALNGTIGAVGTSARAEGSLYFAGLIKDESLFVPGANRLELFVVDRDGRSLRRLGLAELD